MQDNSEDESDWSTSDEETHGKIPDKRSGVQADPNAPLIVRSALPHRGRTSANRGQTKNPDKFAVGKPVKVVGSKDEVFKIHAVKANGSKWLYDLKNSNGKVTQRGVAQRVLRQSEGKGTSVGR